MDEYALFRLLTGERTSHVVAGQIPSRVARALRAETCSVFLSAETVYKQESKHFNEKMALYMRAPNLFKSPYVLIQNCNRAIFIVHEKKGKIRSYKAVVKVTKNRQKLFLMSIHRVDRSDIRAAFRNSVRLTEFEKGA
ncbi:MAG: hypothetical protein U5L06_15635 [Rhodovibrio sp.]|nr:hypothetical protein [Rhodovibrio sp.]